jgi:hypothetical protein
MRTTRASNQTIRLPDGTVVSAQIALVTAAETNNDVNILSAPKLLTTDNQEAEIVVGQTVPFIASTSTSETDLGNTFNTIERRDVGITLRITPQISDGGMVRLNLFEEVSALVSKALINSAELAPVTTIRSATTSVVVRDRQTVVIGGLISDQTDNIEASVPFLADIPVLGNLFRSTTGTRTKINLLIFLTPTIIRTAAEHRDASLEHRDRLRTDLQEQGARYQKRKILDLPSWTPDLREPGAAEDEPTPGDAEDGGREGDGQDADHSAAEVPGGTYRYVCSPPLRRPAPHHPVCGVQAGSSQSHCRKTPSLPRSSRRDASAASPATDTTPTIGSWRRSRPPGRRCWSIPRDSQWTQPRASTSTGGR